MNGRHTHRALLSKLLFARRFRAVSSVAIIYTQILPLLYDISEVLAPRLTLTLFAEQKHRHLFPLWFLTKLTRPRCHKSSHIRLIHNMDDLPCKYLVFLDPFWTPVNELWLEWFTDRRFSPVSPRSLSEPCHRASVSHRLDDNSSPSTLSCRLV